MPTRNIKHAPAQGQGVRVSAVNETVTVNADSANTERIWAGTDVRLMIWPWYGSSISAGNGTGVSANAGQTVYVNSPTAPAGVQVVTST